MLPSPGSCWSNNGAAACSKDDDTGERGGRCGNSAGFAAVRARCADTAVIRWTPPRHPGDRTGMPGPSSGPASGWRRRHTGGQNGNMSTRLLTLICSLLLTFIYRLKCVCVCVCVGVCVCVWEREACFSMIPMTRNLRPAHAHILCACLSLTFLRRSADMKWYFLFKEEKHNFLSLLLLVFYSHFWAVRELLAELSLSFTVRLAVVLIFIFLFRIFYSWRKI